MPGTPTIIHVRRQRDDVLQKVDDDSEDAFRAVEL